MTNTEQNDEPLEWWEGENNRIDPLPHRHRRGFVLTSQTALCGTCSMPGQLVAQHVIEHDACIECKQHAACWHCAERFTSHSRFYGTHWMIKRDSGWAAFKVRQSKTARIKKFFRKLFWN